MSSAAKAGRGRRAGAAPKRKKQAGTRGRMGRVQQLPAGIRRHIDKRLREGAAQSAIIDETAPMLAKLGLPPLSAAGFNRYSTSVERSGQRIREAREAAQAWTRGLGEGGGDVSQHIIEIMRTMIYHMLLRLEGKEGGDGMDDASAKMVSGMALAVRRLETAAKHADDRERELRKRIADEVAEKVKGKGISSNLSALLRTAIEGAA